jgi:hypothetical protein
MLTSNLVCIGFLIMLTMIMVGKMIQESLFDEDYRNCLWLVAGFLMLGAILFIISASAMEQQIAGAGIPGQYSLVLLVIVLVIAWAVFWRQGK